MALKQELLNILRCPVCVHEKDQPLELHRETWLVCKNCGRKYPIVEGIPVMLISEGDKWTTTAQDTLPVPPPAIE